MQIFTSLRSSRFLRALRVFLHVPTNILALLILAACSSKQVEYDGNELSTMNIVDRNGFSETIATPERLKEYENTDFLASQPYQKVLRVYQKDRSGATRACVTSYHPNGQIKQYLDVLNGRASGCYREWYADGRLKVEATVIGGEADIHTGAEQSYLFDGLCKSWDENGALLAEICYAKGVLEGDSLYYHESGLLWKKVPFVKDEIHGRYEVFYSDGSPLQQIDYIRGKKEGKSLRFWSYPDAIAAEESYQDDALITARYFDKNGKQLASIEEGNGFRATFNKEGIAELQQYAGGQMQGLVQRFDTLGRCIGKYNIQQGLKHGEEIENYPYFSKSDQERPQLLITWYEGKIHGPVKTWYMDGVQESQREMSSNAKNGLAMAWYRDGSLMLIEEYAQDRLMKGEYYLKGEMRPMSQVREGSGIATLYDSEGTFLQKVTYKNGVPYE
jgi:antitoxin component YwqK of YwqJK toxin-antitoxin module